MSCSPCASSSTKADGCSTLGQNAGFQYALGYEFDLEHKPAVQSRLGRGRLYRVLRRLPAVLPRRVRVERRGGNRCERQAVRRPRLRHAVRGALVVVRRPEREQPERERVVHLDERRPACRPLSAVHELGAGQVRPAGRRVRPAHGRVLRLLPDRGRLVQAAHADDRPDRGRDRKPVVLDLARHRAGLGLRVRGGAHGRAGRLDDVARRERPHEPGSRAARPGPVELLGRLARDPPVARPVPDAQRGLELQPDRHARASGTPRPAPRARGSSGRSTSPAMPGGR